MGAKMINGHTNRQTLGADHHVLFVTCPGACGELKNLAGSKTLQMTR